MTPAPFSSAAVAHALPGFAVVPVDVVEPFARAPPRSRACVTCSAGRQPFTAIGKSQLGAVTDTLVSLHARLWEDLRVEILDAARPVPSVTRTAQASLLT